MPDASLTNTYTSLCEKIADLQKQACEQGKAYLTEAANELFAKHPNLLGIRWTQYTPSFNDGDECTFTLGDITTKLAGAEGSETDEEDDEDGYEDRWKSPENNDAQALVESIDEGHLRAIFGNGVQITVTREGVDVDDYDCGY